MKYVRLLAPLIVAGVLALAGCGEKDKDAADDAAVAAAPAEVVEDVLAMEAPTSLEDEPVVVDDSSDSALAGDEAKAAAAPGKEQLQQRLFLLVTADGVDFSAKEPRPELEFTGEFRIAGSLCNRFVGEAELVDGVLKADKLAFTRMLCPDEDLNRLETLLGEMLTNGMQVVFDGKVLQLVHKGYVMEYELNEPVQ